MSTFKKNPDEPIGSSKEDRFGRENFAISVAEALVKVPNNQSITVGLYGSWGSGKTSVINMSVDYLAKKYGEGVIVIKFNPWIFSSTESLHLAFFSTLASQLGTKLDHGKHDIAELLEKYGKLTGSLSDAVGMFFPQVGVPTKILSSITKVFTANSDEKTDIEATREKVNELLANSGKRVVVVIDDIDRLDSDEIHQIFKLVKNVAHFKNVSYLLSFDQGVVTNALSTRYPSGSKTGSSFIDKIVQLPLYVPDVDQSLLNKFLTEDLDKIIEQHKLVISDEDLKRFQSVYFVRDIEELFDTPRKVVRFLNTVDFSFERLGNETSFTDTVLVDLLRNFSPDLYQIMARNKQLLLGQSVHGRREDAEKEYARKAIFGGRDPSGLEVTIIRELFPTIDWAFGGAGYAGDFIKGWEEARRICTEKYFNRYFAYDIPVGDIADAKVEKLLAALGEPKTTASQAEKLFKSITKQGDPGLLISKLRRQEEELPEMVSEKLSKLLVSVASELPRPRQAIAGDMMSAYIQSAILAVKLTRNTKEPYKLLQGFIKSCPVNYAGELLRWVEVNSERKKDSPEDFVPLISSEQVDELGKQVADKIKSYAKNHYLQVDYPQDVARLMHIWRKWGSKSDIEKYFERSFKAGSDSAVEFLMSYIGEAYDLMSGTKTRSEFRREAYNEIAKLVDPEIFVAPLVNKFGEEVNKGNFSDARFDKDKSYEFQIAQQFLYIHRKVAEETTSEQAKEKEVIEGEVVSTSTDEA
ncbi:MAG: KAP family P-loop NTPase fold protein [Candidatus Saccharimonadales bacterium]